MRQFLKSLSPSAEFAIVVAVAFGYPMIGSVIAGAFNLARGHISEAHLWRLLVIEPCTMLALFVFLRLRGWTFGRIGLRPGILDSGRGLLLLAVAYSIFLVIFQIVRALLPDLADALRAPDFIAPGFDFRTILLASIVNGSFEEIFVSGYIITALKGRKGFWTAVNVSVAVRLTYHLYQRAVGVVDIVPIGFIFGIYYARSGRLWPLIVAHALVDILSLSPYVGQAG